MAKQVRLEDDVVDALERVASRVGSGSLAHHANRKLRQVLGIDDERPKREPGFRAAARVSTAPKGRKLPGGRRRPTL